VQGLTRSDVAAVLKIPDGTVATRITRGLEKLRAMLEGKGRVVSAAAGMVALEAGLKTLPLAKAPGSIAALEIIRKINAGRTAIRSVRLATRLTPKAGSHAGVAALITIATIGTLAAGGAWWALRASPAIKPNAPAVAAPGKKGRLFAGAVAD